MRSLQDVFRGSEDGSPVFEDCEWHAFALAVLDEVCITSISIFQATERMQLLTITLLGEQQVRFSSC